MAYLEVTTLNTRSALVPQVVRVLGTLEELNSMLKVNAFNQPRVISCSLSYKDLLTVEAFVELWK